MVAQLIGPNAVHYAVELQPGLVASSRDKFSSLPNCGRVQVVHASCLALHASSSMQFDRIYVGAGADEAAATVLFRMLTVGGVLVGPFSGPDSAQRMLRVRRLGETTFAVDEVMQVQFTPLVGPPLSADGRTAQPLAPVALEAPRWSADTHEQFPKAHRDAVRACLLSHARDESTLSVLPKEVLMQVLLPLLEYSAFLPPPPEEPEVEVADMGDDDEDDEDDEESEDDDDEDEEDDEDEDEDEGGEGGGESDEESEVEAAQQAPGRRTSLRRRLLRFL